MFSFNFGSSESNVDISDEEIEPAVRIDAGVQIVSSHAYNSINFSNEYQIKSLTKENLEASLEIDADSSIQKADQSHSDLLPGVYEGGLKIWECTYDLGEYILDKNNNVCFEDKLVLDLGCGAGILGILAMKLGAKSVDFQDYNSGVLKHLTIPNVQLNFSSLSNSRFWFGDWGGFNQEKLYDVILTSETIYNSKNYGKLHRLFKNNLKPDGIILVAAKLYYFGVGGSVGEFCDLVEKKNIFEWKTVWASTEGVKRGIVKLEFKKE